MLVVKSSDDFLDDRHRLQRRTEKGKQRKCWKYNRTEHGSVHMPGTDQRCTNVRTFVSENNGKGE